MDIQAKRIGIWGLGVTGQAAVRFLSRLGAQLEVLEKRPLTLTQKTLLGDYGVAQANADDIEGFLKRHDVIIPSAGIDVRLWHEHRHKMVAELDIFSRYCRIPVIAVTGSVAKTTMTQLIARALECNGLRVRMGGNIGVATLDLIDGQDKYDMLVLEVSSFQLEHTSNFNPHASVITNVFPNHLDRHGTLDEYLRCKYAVYGTREPNTCLIPWDMASYCYARSSAPHTFFSLVPLCDQQLAAARLHDTIFVISDNRVHRYHQGQSKVVYECTPLPDTTFAANWYLLAIVLAHAGQPIAPFDTVAQRFTRAAHRLTKVATHADVDYYNDAKSTIGASTIAAVDQLKERPVLLLLGGISKGADRRELIAQLPACVKAVFCFGSEAQQLHTFCQDTQRTSYAFSTLEDAVTACVGLARAGDQVLLSPAGASYDLFAHYQARGDRFVELVHRLTQS